MYRKFLKNFTITAAILFIAAAALVLFFDPFFHYHGPVAPLKAVLTKKEYQSIGTIRNFNYDSLLVGSSTAENFNMKPLEQLPSRPSKAPALPPSWITT